MNRVSRRTLLAAAAGVAGTAVAGLTPGSARAATEGWWHTPGYTVGNSGFSPHETSILASTVGRVTQKATLLDGSAGLSAPVLDKGRLFTADAKGVTALSESTGERLWRYDFPTDATSSSPAQINIRDGVLTAAWSSHGDNSAPYDSIDVVTLDAVTGATIAERVGVLDGGFTTMLVDRGVIVLSKMWNRWDADVLALRQSDLEPIWGEDDLRIAAPVSAGGLVLVLGEPKPDPQRSEIRDLATGRTLWSGDGFQYNALAANDSGSTFYVAWGHSLQLVSATTGAAKWLASNVSPQHITATPTRLYVSHLTNKVSAFDATTDKAPFWSRTFTAQPLKPIIAGGVLYVTVPGDRVHALDPVTGNTITTTALTGAVTTPVITNGRIYLTDGTKITTYGL